ncbi:queuosine precursor transporter, partial [Luminiphilus sp.]|nr:queuosine precursor transporter [Luminiphilus sp.]
VLEGNVELFSLMYAMTSGAVTASMVAYITAQYCDVQLFHFWKRVTKGKHLWIRNNFSTLLSQLVDSVMVVTVTFGVGSLHPHGRSPFGAVFYRGEMTLETLLILVASNYAFKATVALLDTIPLYILVAQLRRYLQLAEDEIAAAH